MLSACAGHTEQFPRCVSVWGATCGGSGRAALAQGWATQRLSLILPHTLWEAGSEAIRN